MRNVYPLGLALVLGLGVACARPPASPSTAVVGLHGAEMTACISGNTCNFTCPQGGCQFSCASGSTCTAGCAGGGCVMSCATGANCQYTCAGGGCSYRCATGANCSVPQGGATPAPPASTSDPQSTASCKEVCPGCYEAVAAGCKVCPTDSDCDEPGEACRAAATLEKQFGCKACAEGLGREAATDSCK